MSLLSPEPDCNVGATQQSRKLGRIGGAILLCLALCAARATAQVAEGSDARDEKNEKTASPRAASIVAFLGGAATALAAHEAAHLAFDFGFGANPRLARVDYGGIPFFAITHDPVSRRREYLISSAGFSAQHAINEWVLTTRPGLRHDDAPFVKGAIAFNVLASVAYAGAAFSRTGPPERDTRGMAASLGAGGVNERWIGAMVLAPALLDGYRYFVPDSRWAPWVSRAAKIGLVVLVLR